MVRVVDEDGRTAEVGEPGEIIIRGDTVMSGYWGVADATAAALRDGWLYTGDIGSFDEDGFLTLTDRSKDVVISGGMNIYSREVEEVLISHPGVNGCGDRGCARSALGRGRRRVRRDAAGSRRKTKPSSTSCV